MFPNKNHRTAFQRGMTVTDGNVHGYVQRIYAVEKDFPLIAEDDSRYDAKQAILACLEQAHADYQGALPWMLLNRIADALVNRDGNSATIVSPLLVETDNERLLVDAVIHALEATTRVNLDIMRRTTQAGGLAYMHSHDCDDCGITAEINVPAMSPTDVDRFGGNYVSQLFASLEAIRKDLPYKMLETCSSIPAHCKLQ